MDTTPLWSRLTPGPYACGFRSLWTLDHERAYPTGGASPRPILVNLWYPASAGGTRLAYADYLDIVSDDPALADFSRALQKYADERRAYYTLEIRDDEETPAAQVKAFAETLKLPTAAYRDAPPADGRFPIVLVHSGYGSSFEDNSVMCEYLATHGYVVVGSAFQRRDGESLNIESEGATAGDIPFLIAFARTLPFADGSRVGMVGHSGGAHVALQYQATPDCQVDATVSLDTTQDYHCVAHPAWRAMCDVILNARERLTRPILFAASPIAYFELADALTATPRYFYTTDALGHDGFVSVQSLGCRVRRDAGAISTEQAERVWSRFRALCETTRDFLAATLKGEQEALAERLTQSRAEGFRGDAPHLDDAPPGADGPQPYTESTDAEPTPRQLRQILHARSIDAVAAALDRNGWPVPDPIRTSAWAHPAYSSRLAFALLFDSLSRGETDAARRFYQRYNAWMVEHGQRGDLLSGQFLNYGKHFRDRTILGHLLTLEPDHKEAAEALANLPV